jgi:hypothetical protein
MSEMSVSQNVITTSGARLHDRSRLNLKLLAESFGVMEV